MLCTKLWLRSPNDELWLFKQVRGEAERAEDWPEKVASELARQFGIPAAHVELAERDGARGVISLSITHGMDLVHGNELIFARNPQYENWGALVDVVKGARWLAPSFDHASSLGFMLADDERHARLTTKDHGFSVERWAERGKSHFEERPGLVDLATQGLRSCDAVAREYWISRIQALNSACWETILNRIPRTRLSEVAARFASEVMDTNWRRLGHVCDSIGA